MELNLPKGFYYDSVDSTMDEAKRLLYSKSIQENFFVASKCQTKGRGTYGKTWISPANSGVYLSIVYLPKENSYLEVTNLYTKAAGVACREAIEEICNLQVQLKPINDIYAKGKKLGGILVESVLKKEGISCLITGIGINTYIAERKLKETNVPPISIEELVGRNMFKNFSNEKLIKSIVNKVNCWYELIFRSEYEKIKKVFDSYCM